MPHVSRKKLDKKIYAKLFKQFVDVNTNLSASRSEKLLSGLLTETEQIMLTKRLAAVIMLSEGYSQYVIERTLQVSSSTVARIYTQYRNGQYGALITVFKNKQEQRDKFWSTLEMLLRGGMPSMGKDRWKHL